MAVTEVLCFESGSVKGKKQYQCIAKHEAAIRALAGDRRRWPKNSSTLHTDLIKLNGICLKMANTTKPANDMLSYYSIDRIRNHSCLLAVDEEYILDISMRGLPMWQYSCLGPSPTVLTLVLLSQNSRLG